MNPSPYLLGLTGAAVGALGALVGMGGGFLLIPVMTIALGIPMHTAIAAGLVAMVAGASVATLSNMKSGLIDYRVGVVLEVASILGASLGVFVSSLLPASLLRAIFGLVAGSVGLRLMLASPDSETAEAITESHPAALASGDVETPDSMTSDSPPLPWRSLGGLGVCAGFLAGLLGVGGGFLKSPGLVFILKMPSREAAATSLATVLITVSVGAFGHWKLGNLDWSLAFPLAAGFATGSAIASQFGQALADHTRKRLISMALLLAGVAMTGAALQ